MRVEVLLFGPQADLAGAGSVAVDVEPPARVAGVRRALAAACPVLASSLPASKLAVNRRIAGEDAPILGGDEVALIGMVSGG